MTKSPKVPAWIVTTISIVLLVILWQIFSTYMANPKKYPSPVQVWDTFKIYYQTGNLFDDIKISLFRALTGFLCAALLGITLGILTGRYWLLRNSLGPVLHFLRALPPVAILPLFILWFSSVSESSKIATIIFGSFFPIWLNTNIGAQNVSKHYIRNASLLTKSKLKILVHVILPLSLPYIMAGLRAGIANAFIMVFVCELAGANEGIGYTLSNSTMAFGTTKVISGLFVLASLATLADLIIKVSFKKLFPWIDKQ